MEKKITLKEFNNLQDNSNVFVKMIESMVNKYKLEISRIGEISKYDRNFSCVLTGYTAYIEIFYDYEESTLMYKIYSKENDFDKEIEFYILKVINKTNYRNGEIVIDIFGNKYKLLEDYIPNEPKNGSQIQKSMNVFDFKNNTNTKISGSMVAQF